MQPNDQQGYYQPGQDQPVQQPTPVAGPPSPPANPVAPQQPVTQPAAVQQPVAPVSDPELQPVDDGEEYDDGEYDEEYEDIEPVTWNAHEYIHQEKGTMWYMVFAVVLALSVGATVWLQQWTFTAVLVVIAVVIVINSKRPPRELTYTLDGEGLTVDQKLHRFSDFKSFGIIRDGEAFSVMLIPIQRFQPSVSVYFPEESGEAIVDMLGSRLPMKELKLDAVDHLVRWLRL